MIFEYRFTGINQQGRMVQGTFSVNSLREAKKYLARLASQYKLNIKALERRRDFIYTVTLPGKRPVHKHQLAYSKDEVVAALTKMGYSNFKITEVFLDFHLRPGIQDILMFIKLSTTMLKDKMSFGKVLEMLSEEISNRTLKEALLQIEGQLKAGGEGKEIFMQYSKVFGRFPAYMLGLATRSGNMAEVFEATGKFIERDLEIRKSIKKALISPFFAVIATLGAVAYYVQEIFPATAELFLNYNMDLPPMTMATLDASHWLQRFGWILFVVVALLIGAFWQWKQTDRGRIWFDRSITRIPLVGHLIHKSAIEIFFRVFATIYSGSGDNIDNIRIASEACRNAWMEKQIKDITIPKMLREGEAFVESMEASGVFTKTAITRLRTGQETGNILLAAEQIAVFYEAETTYKMNNLIEYIQSIIALFISVVISLLTVISAEIATISPPTGF
ncbi:MAG TPA: type II secretion system F family protein [Candidatus Cloacimonadota bacterium]|nr:type II secretion system F family protein [Candidatus Cloacimonadota bacterium]